jgi:hypothetical protein
MSEVKYTVGRDFLYSVAYHMAVADMKNFNANVRSTSFTIALAMSIQYSISLFLSPNMGRFTIMALFAVIVMFLLLWLFTSRKFSFFENYRKEWIGGIIQDAHVRGEIDTLISEAGCIPPSQKEEEDAA